jgi:hypothetical protein
MKESYLDVTENVQFLPKMQNLKKIFRLIKMQCNGRFYNYRDDQKLTDCT